MTKLTPEFLALVDQADGALDRDTYDQFRRDDAGDWPDDMEITVTVGTRQKINAVFQAIDRMRKSPDSGEAAFLADVTIRLDELHKRAKEMLDDKYLGRPHVWLRGDGTVEVIVWLKGATRAEGVGASLQEAYDRAVEALAEHDPALIDKTLGLDLLREQAADKIAAKEKREEAAAGDQAVGGGVGAP